MSKNCPSCGGNGPFYKDSRSKDGLSTYCRVCVKERNSSYYSANKVSVNLSNNAWKNKNKDKCCGYTKKWADNNKHKVARKNKNYICLNRDKVLAQKISWQSRNKGVALAITRNYQLAKIKRSPIWADKNVIKNIYATASMIGWHVDHEIPLQGKLVSGLHVQNNLRIVRPLDNLKKGNRFQINEDSKL